MVKKGNLKKVELRTNFHPVVLSFTEYLSRPKFTLDGQDITNGTCTTNLTCSMDKGGENVTYSWKVIGKGVNESHDGAILPISWRLGEKDKTLICMARNPISQSSSIPTHVQNLCEGNSLLSPGASGWRNVIFFSSQFL